MALLQTAADQLESVPLIGTMAGIRRDRLVSHSSRGRQSLVSDPRRDRRLRALLLHLSLVTWSHRINKGGRRGTRVIAGTVRRRAQGSVQRRESDPQGAATNDQ